MSFSRPKGLMMLEHVHKLNSFLLGSNNLVLEWSRMVIGNSPWVQWLGLCDFITKGFNPWLGN